MKWWFINEEWIIAELTGIELNSYNKQSWKNNCHCTIKSKKKRNTSDMQ